MLAKLIDCAYQKEHKTRDTLRKMLQVILTSLIQNSDVHYCNTINSTYVNLLTGFLIKIIATTDVYINKKERNEK